MGIFRFGQFSRSRSVGSVFLVVVLGFVTVAAGAERAGRRDADRDRDGWFDGPANQRISLQLTAMQSSKPGDFYVQVNEVRFPHSVSDAPDQDCDPTRASDPSPDTDGSRARAPATKIE